MTLPHRDWRLVVLDRDGTLITSPPEGDYWLDPDDVTLVDGAEESVRLLSEAGLALAVATNQRCVALGLATRSDVDAVNRRVVELLGTAGREIRWYVCPHALDACRCRKPAPGLIDQAVADAGVPHRSAVVVGDRESDVLAGLPGDLGRVLITASPSPTTVAHEVAADLPAAVARILASGSRSRS